LDSNEPLVQVGPLDILAADIPHPSLEVERK
jgi:hypothetical protein